MDLDELKALAAREFRANGLQGWTFALANSGRRLGVCNFRSKRIEIAEYYARESPKSTVIDTLLHEIAHAIAGPAARHGPAWKAVAIRLGATPKACESSGEAVIKPGDWQATCPTCQRVHHRYRRPLSVQGYLCPCPSRSPLTFEFQGDPSRKPVVPLTVADSASWEAICQGCGTVHLRARKPRSGVWRCRCPRRCELTWRPRLRGTAAGLEIRPSRPSEDRA